MFDQKLSVIGEDIEIRLQHEKVIFVIEDIDAATSIVHRKKKKKSKKTAPSPIANGMNGCSSDEQIELQKRTSAIDEDIEESIGESFAVVDRRWIDWRPAVLLSLHIRTTCIAYPSLSLVAAAAFQVISERRSV